MDAQRITVTSSAGTISGEALETPIGSSSSTKEEKNDENAADEKNEDKMSLNEFLIHFLQNHRDIIVTGTYRGCESNKLNREKALD